MLFQGRGVGRLVAPTQPRIPTPFGEVATCVEAGPLDTRRTLPDEHRLLTGGTEWRRWSTDSVVAEVLVGPYRPQLPPDMMVHGCEVVVWRVQARKNVTGLALSCRWNVLPSAAAGGPNSGEGLDAQTWRIDSHTLSMGTEDGEYLVARGKRGCLVPARLVSQCDLTTVQYLKDGLRVPFPSLETDELIQVHFIVARATLDDPDRLDTWFAVDQPPSEILRQLGM